MKHGIKGRARENRHPKWYPKSSLQTRTGNNVQAGQSKVARTMEGLELFKPNQVTMGCCELRVRRGGGQGGCGAGGYRGHGVAGRQGILFINIVR
ncbi:unnamed protein product [Calypogeia fissa]